MTDAQPSKRTRESTSKVRTGCTTCKARRIKCDETKPTCRRCGLGGRACEYQSVKQTTSAPRNHIITIYVPPAVTRLPTGTAPDRWHHLFQHKIAATLDQYFECQFWSRLVLQLSLGETPVPHAVTAASILYQDVESSWQQHSDQPFESSAHSRREWISAVRSLSSRIDAQPESSLVPMVCCLIFTCIDFLRGDFPTAMLHARAGLEVASQLRPGSKASIRKRMTRAELQAVEEHVVPVFARLNILCLLSGIDTPPSYIVDGSGEDGSSNLTHSWRKFSEIAMPCLYFIQKVTDRAAQLAVTVEDLVEQARLRTSLTNWRAGLESILQTNKLASIAISPLALHTLLVQYKMIYIWTLICTSHSKSAADEHLPDFQQLINSVEEVVRYNGDAILPILLTYDAQLVGALYFTTLECRHSPTRRRALHLLQQAPRREGLWNVHEVCTIAERIVEAEERILGPLEWPEESARLYNPTTTMRLMWMPSQEIDRVLPPAVSSEDPSS